MSGILGIYNRDGRPVDREVLGHMAELQAHRGPDGVATWAKDKIGLGHAALHTTPQDAFDAQQLRQHSGAFVVTADVRLDNRDELISALGLRGRPPHELTDMALIAAAYERWGEECPSKLLGDFAFALWDARREVLFCARDHFGIKPFYYFASDASFVFASEIKAILAVPGVPRRVNAERVAEYIASFHEDRQNTFYKDVLRLPPAHSLTVGARTLELRTYWSLDPERELRLGSDDEYVEAFRSLFIESVRCRLSASHRTGAMLSGGLDSSSVASTARHILSEGSHAPLDTFSFVFDEISKSDERPFIETVLAQGGFNPQYILADGISPFGDLDAVLWHVDEPHLAFSMYLNWESWRRANELGNRIILDGFLGDSTISYGYAYLAELARQGRWRRWATEVKPLCAQHGPEHKWKALRFYAAKQFLDPLLLAPLRRTAGLIHATPNPGVDLLHPDLRRTTGIEERIRAQYADQFRAPKTARSVHYRDLSTAAYSVALDTATKAAAAHGIELRFPFSDRRLMEFCLALPPDQKLKAGWSRSILRRGLKGILPEPIRRRMSKGNVGYNFKHALHTHGRELTENVLMQNIEVMEPYLDLPALRDLSQRFSLKQDDVDVAPLWTSVVLGAWLRTAEAPLNMRRKRQNPPHVTL